MQRTYMSFKSWLQSLEDAGGSRLGFAILIPIRMWSVVFDTSICWISVWYLDFKGAKNIHVLKVLTWGFEGSWKFQTWVWQLDLDLYMVTGLGYSHVPNYGSLSWFWRCKGHPCPLSTDLGLWRMLEVPDWGSASWFWFICGTGLCYTNFLNFRLLSWFWKWK